MMAALLYSLMMVVGASGPQRTPVDCGSCLFMQPAVAAQTVTVSRQADVALDGDAVPVPGVVAPEGLQHLFLARSTRPVPKICDASLLVSAVATKPMTSDRGPALVYRAAAGTARGSAWRAAAFLSEPRRIARRLWAGCSL